MMRLTALLLATFALLMVVPGGSSGAAKVMPRLAAATASSTPETHPVQTEGAAPSTAAAPRCGHACSGSGGVVMLGFPTVLPAAERMIERTGFDLVRATRFVSRAPAPISDPPRLAS
jgi:hypothetical protein